ncbi:tRNA pseudouridine(38-40) synthase TruA [Flammeovirga aprica]|uniref:tRNA pseudouridine synthase A n=1 Tax=Flammeovirga aprica JL-4 TaxID=694437 RepID=A0A7X9RXQ6_9BACT|nr:tRNA pseudouridine(38-40) synthase TruA [Flammeovirga aprica]NME70524.1 tRNA pseudouridine(38-40) synthase TruA [Flammeovirga aprica JL-4]
MKKQRHNYLIEIQYIGYRFHGWMVQPGLKTVQGMINKTINFVLGGEIKYKTLGTSRTDTYVSANHSAFELFVWEELNEEEFFELFNKNLPNDIRALSIQKVGDEFNIIQSSKRKEYQYLFSFGTKNHPFCAPFMTNITHDLDLELMMEGAKLYVGEHYFGRFCKQPKEGVSLVRKIDYCEIKENDVMSASFFPEKSYIFHVHGKGFMRHQVRLMIGTLFMLGKGELSLEDIKNALKASDDRTPLGYVAPASGLNLHAISYEDEVK